MTALKTVHEVEQVVGILSGGVEVNVKADGAVVFVGDLLQALAQQGIAVRRLDEGKLGGSGLQVFAQKGSVVAVACGVDADADGADFAFGRLRTGSVIW